MGYGALEMRFDAYPQRQFVTESININSLADRHIWSTIKTLPATLPEPSFKVRGSRSQFHGPLSSSHGHRTGVNVVVACSDLVLVIGVGPKLGRALCLETRSFDGLAKAMRCNFVWNNGIIIRVSGVRVPPPLPFLSM